MNPTNYNFFSNSPEYSNPQYYPNVQDLENSQEQPNFQYQENPSFSPNLNQTPTTQNFQTSQSAQTGARGDKWEAKEDVALMSSWCLASEDKIRGKNQRKGSLWARVLELYEACRVENPEEINQRNENQMKGRWKRLNENANKWVAAYREACGRKKSGMSMKDVEKEAHAIYEASGNKFNDFIVFNEVMSKHPKWELQLVHDTIRCRTEDVGNEESGGSSTKRSKTSEEGEYVVHKEIPGGSTFSRPTGRDAAKKGKGKASQSSNPTEFVSELRAMRITKESEINLLGKRLDLELKKEERELKKEERELKKEERKAKKMYHVHLNTLLAKSHLTEEDEDMKRMLLTMLYGN